MAIANQQNSVQIEKLGPYCDRNLYYQLLQEKSTTGKKPTQMVTIIKDLEQESNFYEMNEFELSLLIGKDVNSLRNNRRPGVTHRWPFKKEDTGKDNSKSPVTYPMKWIRDMLDIS